MSLDRFFKRWDSRYGIPRPTSALYLDAYQAGLRFLSDVGKGSLMLVAGAGSSVIWWEIGNLLQKVGIEINVYLPFVIGLCVLIGLLDAGSVAIPYYRLAQNVTYGSARWAQPSELRDFGLVVDNREELSRGTVRIGRLGRKHDLVLSLKHVLCHTAIFGPPGSGKSSSFFMSMAKDWSPHGSAIFLDPKGELYTYTARYFKRAYRLDLSDPRFSDRWNFVPACSGDPELANEIASIIVGYDANKNVSYDPFWPQAETALLTSLLLHLPRIADNPTPAHLAEFIATRTFDQIHHEMMNSPDPEAQIKWGIFKKADREKTQGGIYIGLGTKLDPLRSPHAMAVMQSVTDEERLRGLREINLYDLRKPSTAIYVVVPEGDATRYKIVLSILFGLAASVTRKTSNNEEGAPVLLALDEAGNIPLHNLSEALGVGRGRRCGIVLGYQNIGQLYKQYGRDGAQAILGSIGGMIFLPGLDVETAQYASKRVGRTTALQHRSVDATGAAFDHEGLTETGRDLIDAGELRQMIEHSQAVGIFGSIPPIRFGFPKFAKVGRKYHALPRELTTPLSLAQVEAAYAVKSAEESNGDESVSVDLTVPVGSDNFGGSPSDQETSDALMGLGSSGAPSAGETKVDMVEFLTNSDDGNLDSVLQRMIIALRPPVVGGETGPDPSFQSPPDHSEVSPTQPVEVGGRPLLPEVSVPDVWIDPKSVLEVGPLEDLDEDVGKPSSTGSGQLTFGWGTGQFGDETAMAAPRGVKGARR
jgi:type IV secretion system protein VirD4